MAYKCPNCNGRILWTVGTVGPLRVDDNGQTGMIHLIGECEECGLNFSGDLSGDIIPDDSLETEDED